MRKKLVIIGAGPGGLAAALLAAAGGDLDVTVLEKADRPGGRCSAIQMEGFTFDTGPTFFLYPQPLADIFQSAGYDLYQELDLIRLDPHYELVFGSGGRLVTTPDIARMEQEVAKIAPQDAPNIRRFMSDNSAKLAAFKPVLEMPFTGFGDLINGAMPDALKWLRPTASVDTDLKRYFKDPRVRLAFSFQSKYLGMSPFQCPSLFTILSFLEYRYGVFHPRGGCNAVMDKMAQLARKMGVKIEYNAPVSSLNFKDRTITGVNTPTAHYTSDAVIMNADFAHTMPQLVPDKLRSSWTDKRIAKARYSCSTFMLYLGIRGKVDHLQHHTIYLSGDYERNINDIAAGIVPQQDPSVYVQNACVTDPSLAPEGCSALYVLVPVPHETADANWETLAPAFRTMILKQVADKFGIPDLEQRIMVEKMLTPASWRTEYAVHKGAVFNLAHNLTQMLLFRPQNRFADVGGLYLVGGGTHPGSGLPVIFESARISSKLMRQDLGLPALDFAPTQQTKAEAA